ncbi:uncharacterized protein LOC129655324 isoform X3 [Bubalus kerabau]|uniref:uncharacterized protein LOC129655324 isoform X3 n=1 Tax=Bubalus carabanensis TaxID=3119969 RepID=UPI00244E693A|nr:uncharacterized protein LOC129655324 isoform X3 [Bubalus carabanensis]
MDKGLKQNSGASVSSSVAAAAAAAKPLQSCSTLCDPIDGSPPGSPASGILQKASLTGYRKQENGKVIFPPPLLLKPSLEVAVSLRQSSILHSLNIGQKASSLWFQHSHRALLLYTSGFCLTTARKLILLPT